MKFTIYALFLIAFIPSTILAKSLYMIESNNNLLRINYTNNIVINFRDSQAEINKQDSDDNIILNNYNLPVLSTMIQIPANHKAVVNLVNPVYKEIAHIELTKTDEDIIVNDEHVMLSDPFIMRNNLLASLSLQPYVYNSTEAIVKILEKAEIHVEFVSDSRFTIESYISQSKEFKTWLSKSVINYNDNSRLGDANGSLLIIYNQTASPLSYIQPLIDWKHQKGWIVEAASTAVTGTSTTSIKNYIQNAYNTSPNPPEYILLLGKSNQLNYVSTFTEYYHYNTVGDYKYTLLEGNDIIPDAYIGRLTFTSTDQLTTMINKIISYEKQVGLGTNNWYNSGLLVSDETDSGPSCTTNIDYVKGLMHEYDPTTQVYYVNSGTFPTQIYNALNQGVSSFYYRGHNGYSGMTNIAINNIINTGKYPFISMITCFSGNFGSTSQLSIGEQFMRIGTASIPKGGIGFIGSSCETHTCLNNIMTGAIAYGFYREGLTNQGQALHRAKLALQACYPQNPDNYLQQNFQSLNLLGDPTVDIWLRQPTAIVVQHAQNAGMTNGFLRVAVTDTTGNPVEQAQVCLLKGDDEVFQVGYTNSNGIFVFEWNQATTGFATLTVTKPNHTTYQTSIEFLNETAPVSIANLSLFDELSSGATYSFPLSLSNDFYSALFNVSATFSSSSECISIQNGNLTYGNIALNQTQPSLQNLEFSVVQNCPQDEILPFTLEVQGMYGDEFVTHTIYFQAIENGPNLQVYEYQLAGDNILSPGESSGFTVNIKNIGAATAIDIIATVYSYNPNVSFSQATQTYPNLSTGVSNFNSTPYIVIADSTLYIGTPILVFVEVNYNNGASQILQLTLTIGSETQDAMTGPDSYGYICVAGTDDHPLAKPYNWIELNPTLGGTGTQINIADNNTEGSGSYYTIDLSFTFKYYGIEYNQITVCSNGFIMPGSQGSQEWMNWQIPGPMVPKPIIAPFWDDLIIYTDSRIFFKNDVENGMLIVEWYNLRNKYNISVLETFEVILYHENIFPTPTGDSAILFQYKIFNNIDAGNYGVAYVDHGQYATVGIADHTGIIGIQYTYQNIYPDTALPLTHNSTLFFSTIQNQNFSPYPIIQSYEVSELVSVFPNDQVDCGETISINPIVINTGSYALAASTVTLTTSDEYVSIINGNSTLDALDLYQSSQINVPFQVLIADDCPNLREITFNITIFSDGIEYDFFFPLTVNAPQIEFSSLLIDNNDVNYINLGVTAAVSLQIENHSNLDLINSMFQLQSNPDWTINPSQFLFNLPAYSTITVNFDLQTTDTAHLGEMINLSGLFNYTDIYDSLFTVDIYVGQMDTIKVQNFDNPALLNQWIISTGVSVIPAQHINTSGYEVVVDPAEGITNYTLTSAPIAAYDSQLMLMRFKYLNLNSNFVNLVLVSFDDTNAWQTVYDFSDIHHQTTEAEFVFNSIPSGVRTMKIRWQLTLPQFTNGILVLDDLVLKAIHHPKGFVTGTVNLDFNQQNVTQVRISSSAYPDNYVNPNSDGTYSLPLYQGTYDYIKAEHSSYLTLFINDINVVSSQNTENNNFALNYMRKPVNILYNIDESVLNLNWQLENPDTRDYNRQGPNFYRIYITHNEITVEDTTYVLSYQYDIEYGTYEIYIKSVYITASGTEMYSQNSDILEIEHTGNNDNSQIPVAFDLKQNYPNPFNPKTTISYAVNKPDRTNLTIYNVKGEAVRILVNENQKAGFYQVEFDGLNNNHKSLPSGMYFYRLTSGSNTITRKMILLK